MFNSEIKSSFSKSQRKAKLHICPETLGCNELPINLGELWYLVVFSESNALAVDSKNLQTY